MLNNIETGSTRRPLAGTLKDVEKRPSNLVVVTPEVAKDWIEHNIERNRPKVTGTVLRYARIMKRGEWRPNPSQPISFTKNNILVNGQHRLEAVVKAGVPVTMAVVWDAEEKDFDVIDTGKKRTLGDIFALDNIKNSNGMAAAVMRCVALSQGHFLSLNADGSGGGFYSSRLDLAEGYLKEYHQHHDLYQEVFNWGKSLQRGKVKTLALSDLCGITMFLITKLMHDKETVFGFWGAFYNGGGAYKYLQELQKWLNDDIKATTKMRSTRKQSLIAKAWNMYLAGKRETSLRVRTNEIAKFN